MTTENVQVDVLVIGAGPAGLAAVAEALDAGATVACVDSNTQPGGQFWRHLPENVVTDDGRLHHGWGTYRELRARFDAGIESGRLTFLPCTSVWMVQASADGSGFDAHLTSAIQRPQVPAAATSGVPIVATAVVMATGGYDRQLPAPGWDLPGVMAAGGIQATIKGSGVLPGRRVLLAGTGPFLLPVAANVLAAGGEVLAVCEAASLTGWVPHALTASKVPSKGIEGAEYAGELLKHRVPYLQRRVITEIHGTDGVESVTTAKVDASGNVLPGTERVFDDVDIVGLGYGFTPQIELGVQLELTTRTDVDDSVVLTADDQMASSQDGVFVAGEITGVGGWLLSVTEGHVAGRAAAAKALKAPDAGTMPDGAAAAGHGSSGMGASPTKASPTKAEARTIRRHRDFAAAMHTAHPVPPKWEDRLTEQTLVCRCEEVSAGDIVVAKDEALAQDARASKQVTRAGMGWCQGRMCGFATACLAASGAPTREQMEATSKRPVSSPVTLATLIAGAAETSEETSTKSNEGA
ncbi:MAG: FAD-dependent oxidoreductase [Galactobacter sp.]